MDSPDHNYDSHLLMVHWPTEIRLLIDISIGSAFFAQLTLVPNTYTQTTLRATSVAQASSVHCVQAMLLINQDCLWVLNLRFTGRGFNSRPVAFT